MSWLLSLPLVSNVSIATSTPRHELTNAFFFAINLGFSVKATDTLALLCLLVLVSLFLDQYGRDCKPMTPNKHNVF